MDLVSVVPIMLDVPYAEYHGFAYRNITRGQLYDIKRNGLGFLEVKFALLAD